MYLRRVVASLHVCRFKRLSMGNDEARESSFARLLSHLPHFPASEDRKRAEERCLGSVVYQPTACEATSLDNLDCCCHSWRVQHCHQMHDIPSRGRQWSLRGAKSCGKTRVSVPVRSNT
jgi:hypothetical protein